VPSGSVIWKRLILSDEVLMSNRERALFWGAFQGSRRRALTPTPLKGNGVGTACSPVPPPFAPSESPLAAILEDCPNLAGSGRAPLVRFRAQVAGSLDPAFGGELAGGQGSDLAHSERSVPSPSLAFLTLTRSPSGSGFSRPVSAAHRVVFGHPDARNTE